jgi:dCTP diphosphatase
MSTPTSADDTPARLALPELREALRRFAAERDWDQFHSPKNLAAALSVEAAELLEHFQWLTEAGSRELAPAQRVAVGEEMADVLLYLVRLADKLDIDLLAAATAKLALNAQKYPVDRARGSSRKYTEL